MIVENGATKSKAYDAILSYYLNGFWSKEKVYNAVTKGKITEEEYEEIIASK